MTYIIESNKSIHNSNSTSGYNRGISVLLAIPWYTVGLH
jgi:hypothetical protein